MTSDHGQLHRTDASIVKVCFPLSAQDVEQGVEAENLWAFDLGSSLYKIDSIPFYVYGVSCGDTVNATAEGGRITFRSVVDRGGHSTYRVLIKGNSGIEDDRFKRLWKKLAQLGCSREVAKTRLVSIDIPPEGDADAVYEILQLGKSEGIWTFEEAHCGHPISNDASTKRKTVN